MNGIDISRYQKGIDLSVVPCEFVIVKATQGTSYVSPEFKKQILCILSIKIIEGKCTERHSDQDSVSETGNKPEQDT